MVSIVPEKALSNTKALAVAALMRTSFSRRMALYFGVLFVTAIGILFALWYWGVPPLDIAGARDQRMDEALRILEIKADLQHSLIAQGIGERRGDILLAADSDALIRQLAQGSPAIQTTLSRLFAQLQRAYPERYRRLLIVEPASRRILASNIAAEQGRIFPDAALVARAAQADTPERVEQVQQPESSPALLILRQLHALDADGHPTGKLLGLLIAHVDLQQLISDSVQEPGARRPSATHTVLLNASGQVLTRYPEPPSTPLAFDLVPLALSGFDGTQVQVDAAGHSYAVVYRHFPLNGTQGWTLVHYASQAQALGALKAKASTLMGVGLLLTLIALACIGLAARHLTRPLQALEDAARRLGAGDLFVRFAPRAHESREIGTLAQAFNAMADDIQKSHQTLEDKVRDRTAALRQSEARHRTLFESSPDALLVLDTDTVIDCNPAALKMFGVARREELIGRHPAELSPAVQPPGADSRALANQRMQEATTQGSLAFEWLHHRLDSGHPFLAEVLLNRVALDQRTLIQGTIRDISARKQAEEQLRLSEQNLAITLQSIGEAVIATDAQGRITRMNTAAEQLTGWRLTEAGGRPLPEVFHVVNAQTRAPAVNPVQSVMAGGHPVHLDNPTVLLSRDGQEYQIADSAAPMRDPDGQVVGVVLVFSDVTQRRHAEADLRIAAIAFESQEGMYVADAAWRILRVNRAFSDITGYSSAEALGQVPRQLLGSGQHDDRFYALMTHTIAQHGTWQGEVWDRRKNGEVFPVWLIITEVRAQDGTVTHYVASMSDITQRKAAEDQIKNLAFYDPLTQLPNRRLLMNRLDMALSNGLRHHRKGALLFVDLDNFKTLNDTLGHDQGDLLLQQVAARLRTCIREGDTVARLGGDEFVVMLEDLSEVALEAATQAEAAGEKILAALAQAYQLGQYEHHSTPSIGITLFAEQHESIDEPLKRADLAMYQAKAAGRNTLRFFDPKMQAVVTARVALESGLREALAHGQFVLHYQGQVATPAAHMAAAPFTGAEALVRWQHPQRGIVSPAEFIALAEETGLILPLGNWVLETACHQLAAWAEQPTLAHLTVAVNVSALQFSQRDFVESVLAVLTRTGANPHRLKLELTEGLLVANVEDVIAKMVALRNCGVRFSLDDFGTGYSSLSYLKRLPLSQLKIDQGFVRDILVDPNDAAIAQMVIVLAQSLGLSVMAEGVETEAQRDFLARHGCHAYQGYLFSRPVPVAEFESLVLQDAAPSPC